MEKDIIINGVEYFTVEDAAERLCKSKDCVLKNAKAGCYDYIMSPIPVENRVRRVLVNAGQIRRLAAEALSDKIFYDGKCWYAEATACEMLGRSDNGLKFLARKKHIRITNAIILSLNRHRRRLYLAEDVDRIAAIDGYTREEAADIIGVSLPIISRLIKEKEIAVVSLEGVVPKLLKIEDVEKIAERAASGENVSGKRHRVTAAKFINP